MGKLSDFFAKIKGLFNRNKALPEGKEENYIMPNISERKEEAKKTEHENFVNTLQKQAKSFDLSQMPVEDAISKALEEKGLNSNIANNPEFKKQVNDVFAIYLIPYDIKRARQSIKERDLPPNIEDDRLREVDEHIKNYSQNEDLRKQFDYVIYNDYTEKTVNKIIDLLKVKIGENK